MSKVRHKRVLVITLSKDNLVADVKESAHTDKAHFAVWTHGNARYMLVVAGSCNTNDLSIVECPRIDQVHI
jgi:hypothetical protein